MRIELKQKNKAFHLVAKNEDGNTIDIDGASKIGGENKGFRPMQLLAAGAGREENVVPSLFTSIHLYYLLTGQLEKEKVEQAIKLSLETYCSVVKILEKTARITHSYEIIPG